MGESRCELLESSSKMFYVIFHQETDPKVKKLFYEIIYCMCGAQKRPVLQGLSIKKKTSYSLIWYIETVSFNGNDLDEIPKVYV